MVLFHEEKYLRSFMPHLSGKDQLNSLNFYVLFSRSENHTHAVSRMIFSSSIALIFLATIPSAASAQTSIDLDNGNGSFVDTTIAWGLKLPTAMELSPDGRLFVAQEGGNVTIVKDGQTPPSCFSLFLR